MMHGNRPVSVCRKVA